jgi:TonB family protein
MPVRYRGKGGSSWRRSLSASVGVHALVLGALGVGVRAQSGLFDRAGATTPGPLDVLAENGMETPTLVDLTAIDSMLPPVSTSPPDVLETLVPTAVGDRTNAVPAPQPNALDGTVDRRAPAPDRGAADGRVVDDPAWRRDASTLHERLTDGADVNQPAHTRTSRQATSAQAVRREPETGIGDSPRNQRAARAIPVARYGVIDPNQPGDGEETVEETNGTAVAQEPPSVAPVAARAILAATQGPLDAERGTRSFDVDKAAFIAADDHAARAASNATNPSITDLTLATVSGNTREGRGPADTPGVVARAGTGQAPALAGMRSTAAGSGDQQATQERIYDRYKLEIRSRVDRALVWPRRLAIRLEQGETILRFVVQPDGKLAGEIQVSKSSGFVEFDQAALDAVRKASPFPPMPNQAQARALPVALRVPFLNPVIR